MKINFIKYSSKAWLNRHNKDVFRKKSIIDHYRARSAYKLLEIDNKYNIFNRSGLTIDLGSNPGSWSQVAIERVNSIYQHNVISLDLLDMAPLEGCEFIQGDFMDPRIQEKIKRLIDNREVSTILSDMAPSFSGIKIRDDAQSKSLIEQAILFSDIYLKDLMGNQYNELNLELKKRFHQVDNFKPKASRLESREIYYICLNKIL